MTTDYEILYIIFDAFEIRDTESFVFFCFTVFYPPDYQPIRPAMNFYMHTYIHSNNCLSIHLEYPFVKQEARRRLWFSAFWRHVALYVVKNDPPKRRSTRRYNPEG
jgi:hypothetical protein